MKKVVIILISGLLLGFTISSFAATDLKIGVVNTASILAKSARFTNAKKQLQTSLASSQKKVKGAQDALRAEYAKLQGTVAKMSAVKRKQLTSKVNKDRRNLLKLSQELGSQEQKAQQATMKQLSTSLNQAINQVAKQNGLTLVLTKRAAVYADPQFDITKQVAAIFG